MARVGNSIIKGIEVHEIVTKLNRAYADEWLAYYQYGGTWILRAACELQTSRATITLCKNKSNCP